MGRWGHSIAVCLMWSSCFLLALPAHADGWRKLHAAVQRWRVAALDGLPADLLAIQKSSQDPEVASVAAFVRARALARLGDGEAAQRAFADATAVRAVLPEAWRWAEVEVLLASGKPAAALDALDKLRHDFGEFRWSAADLLYSRLWERVGPGDQTAAIALTLYAKSQLNLPRDELLARAARNLAINHPQEALVQWRKLILKHPESAFVDEALQSVPESALADTEQFERMERLFARRAYERCREIGLKLWDKGVRKSEVGYYLGKIATERLRDDYPGAAKYLEAAIGDGEPLAQQALTSYALVLTKLGRLDDGLAEFDKWFQRYPGVSNEKRVDVAYDRARDTKLRAIGASHLFEPNTIQIGIRRNHYLRGYMFAFIEMFAPHLKRAAVEKAITAMATRRVQVGAAAAAHHS